MKRALALILCSFPAYGTVQQLPIGMDVICDDNYCVIRKHIFMDIVKAQRPPICWRQT
jgi:hypothetical protein